jgi:N-acetylneuraminic acid mutarotase
MKTRAIAVLATAVLTVACGELNAPSSPSSPPGPWTSIVAAPSDGAWRPIARMTAPRQQHATATGSDGRIYAFEGVNSSTWVRGSEVYDPRSDTWSTVASPGGWCCGGAARGADGRLYLIGGESEAGGIGTEVQSFEPSTNTWVAVAPISISRYILAVVSGADGRVYAIGGVDGGDARRTLNTGEVFSPATGTWTGIAPMATPRWYHAAATGPDGRVYVFGGMTGFTPLTSAEVYDPQTDRWAAIAPLPDSRYGHAAVTGSDGYIYVFGGVVNNGGSGKSAVAYDPSTDTWTSAPDLTVGRTQLAAAAGLDGRPYATGGFDPAADVTDGAEFLASVSANLPPIAFAGEDQRLECVDGGADVVLDASGSSDPEGEPLTYEWREGSWLIGNGQTQAAHLPLGTHDITLRVADPADAASASTCGPRTAVCTGSPPYGRPMTARPTGWRWW